MGVQPILQEEHSMRRHTYGRLRPRRDGLVNKLHMLKTINMHKFNLICKCTHAHAITHLNIEGADKCNEAETYREPKICTKHHMGQAHIGPI